MSKEFDFSSQNAVDNAFKKACAKGELNKIRAYLTAPCAAFHADIHADDEAGLRMACHNGHLEVVRYLLESPELIQTGHARIYPGVDYLSHPLKFAARGNQIQVVQYLATQAGHDESIPLKTLVSEAFVTACEKGHLATARYLLLSPEIVQYTASGEMIQCNADLHHDGDCALLWSAAQGHLEIVKYLLCSSELDEHIDVHVGNDYVLEHAYHLNHYHLLNYLVFEWKIEVTPAIEVLMNQNPELAALFEKRSLTHKLTNMLDANKIIPKNKI